MRTTPRRHHILLGQQLLGPARQRHNPVQLGACESHRLRRVSRCFKSFKTNALLSNTYNNKRNKTMTNQENVSSLESAWDHGYKRGVEDQKKKTKKVKKCLRKERQRTEKLEKSITDANLQIPDRNQKYWRKIFCDLKSFFSRRWRSMLTVFLITLILASFAISRWPHYHNEDLHSHWRNPLVVIAYD